MWNNIGNATSRFLKNYAKVFTESKRNTFIFRRTRGIRLNKLGAQFPKKLKRQQFYYELVENTDLTEKPLLELILLKDVPGIGMTGDKIKADCYTGYRDFLLPKLATYITAPEAKNIVRTQEEKQYSSIHSKIVGNYLKQQVLNIYLNSDHKWTLEPWHIKLALRQIGVVTDESCITIPEQKISGPDSEVENKDFIVKITMNNSEVFPVRCRIRQVLNENISNLSVQDDFVECNPLFPEEKEEVEKLIKEEKQLQETKSIREVINKVAF